jgi:hypothetical protein
VRIDTHASSKLGYGHSSEAMVIVVRWCNSHTPIDVSSAAMQELHQGPRLKLTLAAGVPAQHRKLLPPAACRCLRHSCPHRARCPSVLAALAAADEAHGCGRRWRAVQGAGVVADVQAAQGVAVPAKQRTGLQVKTGLGMLVLG